MRNPLPNRILISLAALALSVPLLAQERGPQGVQPGFVAAGIPEMPNPPGPAPKHDLTGVWIGPVKRTMGPYPEMTPAGRLSPPIDLFLPQGGSK